MVARWQEWLQTAGALRKTDFVNEWLALYIKYDGQRALPSSGLSAWLS